MASCERVNRCPLFQQFSIKAALRVWVGQYCETDFGRCERLKLALQGQPVPRNMLPNGRMLKVALEQAEMNDVI
jgi:hypothetical protein